MKKNMKIVAALMAVGLVSPMAYATNGNEMMAVGAQSTALGGTGVANYMGADNAWANPALLGKSKGSEVVGGVTYFKPTVTNTGFGVANTSSTKESYIPDVSYSSRINNSLSYGVAMAGIAGMGVDYTTAPANTHVAGKTIMSIARVIATIAYNDKDFGIGFSPILQYGSLQMAYTNSPTPYKPGADTDTGFGASLGGYYNVTPAVVVAASYQTAIAMTYGTQISKAAEGFGLCSPAGGGCTGQAGFGDKLAQPAKIQAGVAYTIDNVTLTADYKSIQWSSAAGFKDFNWKDQTVVAVGAKYAGNGYWVGAGYNKANDPIKQAGPSNNGPNLGGTDYRNGVINFFNNELFPAVVQNSVTFGGGYELSKTLSLEGAVVMSPEVKKTVDITSVVRAGAFNAAEQVTPGTGAAAAAAVPAGQTNITTHSQNAISVSLRYKF